MKWARAFLRQIIRESVSATVLGSSPDRSKLGIRGDGRESQLRVLELREARPCAARADGRAGRAAHSGGLHQHVGWRRQEGARVQ